MYDIVIVVAGAAGAGPAGVSAGIYAKSRGKKVLIIEKEKVGGLIGKVSTVTHYAGILNGETGISFAERLKEQAERGKKVLIIEKEKVGGLIGKVSTVTHYAGILNGETGISFAERLKEQAENSGIEIVYEDVNNVDLKGDVKLVFTNNNLYKAKKIIIANGTRARKLGIEGELELAGKGIIQE